MFLLCLAIISQLDVMQAQCSTSNSLQHQGGAITCNFPFLCADDVNHYTNLLQTTDAQKWYAEKSVSSQRTVKQWKTTNLRILLLTNHADIINDLQIEKLKLAMNLHLVELAEANKSDFLEWSHMPIVEEIIIEEYPDDLSYIFDVVGYLVFSDPDERNGETQLNKLVRELAVEHNINTVVNLMDSELDIPFGGAAQIHCNDPGEFMTVSIKKNNTISLSDKYLVQFAQACVHTIGHTNNANHQKSMHEDEASLICNEYNQAFGAEFESTMINGLEGQKMRTKKSKPFGKVWSKTNAEQIIDSYIQRGLLLPLFDYNNQEQEENPDNKIEDSIAIFPNPVAEILTIELTNDTQYEMSIFNVNGKLINQQKLDSFVTQLDVSDYDSGMYIFKFVCASSGESFTKKIEKIK